MADTRLNIIVSAKNETSSQLKAVEKQLTSLKKETDNATKSISSMGGGFSGITKSIMSATVQLVGFYGAAVAIRGAITTIVGFDKAMHNVDSIAKLSKASLASVSDEVLQMSKTLPQSAETLSKGLYQIYSSGFQGKEAMEVLKQSAIGASAGLTTTEVAATGLMAVMNAYNMKTGPDAKRIMDIMFKTVDKGVITFDQLASEVGMVASQTSLLGIPFKDVGAAIGYMTLKGASAGEAVVGLNMMTRSFIKPSQEMSRVIKIAGYESGETMLKTIGLAGSLKVMQDASGGSLTKLVQLIPEIRGTRASAQLLSAGLDEMNKYFDQFSNTTDAATSALDRQSEAVSFQYDLMKNNFNATLIEATQSVLPDVITAINDLSKGISDNKETIKDLVKSILELSGSLARLVKEISPVVIAFFVGLSATIDFVVLAFNKMADAAIWVKDKIIELANTPLKYTSPLLFGIDLIVKKFKSMKVAADAAVAATHAAYNSSPEKKAANVASFTNALTGKLVNQWEQSAIVNGNRASIDLNRKPIVNIGGGSGGGKDYSSAFGGSSNAAADKAKKDAEDLKKRLQSLKDKYEEIKNSIVGSSVKKIVGSLQELKIEHQTNINESRKKLAELDNEYIITQSDGIKAIKKLKEENVANFKDIDKSIQGVVDRMNQLDVEFNKAKKSDIANLADAFVQAEQKVIDLKEQLKGATTADEIVKIREQIRAEEAGLAATADTQRQYTTEIAEAKRRAGLSDIQRTIEDFNTKRALAQEEYNVSKANFDAEMSDLNEKRIKEQNDYNTRVLEAKNELSSKLADITTKRNAQIADDKMALDLYNLQTATLNQILKNAETIRRTEIATTFKATEDAVNKEIEMYQNLANAIKNANSAKNIATINAVASPSISNMLTPLGVSAFLSNPFRGGKQIGGLVGSEGSYHLHGGEYVVPRMAIAGGGNNVYIQGGTYLSESVAERIGDMIIHRLKNNVRI